MKIMESGIFPYHMNSEFREDWSTTSFKLSFSKNLTEVQIKCTIGVAYFFITSFLLDILKVSHNLKW